VFLNKENLMKIKVPQDINDITVGEYIKFNEINKEDTDDEFLIHKTINIFCGVDMRDIMNMDYEDAEMVASDIFHALSRDCKFSERFTLNGVEYGFITSLEGLTLGEYIDLETYLKDQKDLHKAAAVMYRPIVKQYRDLYEIEPYNSSIKNQELMKQAPVGTISQAVVFFYNIAKELLRGSLISSEKEDQMPKIIQQRLNLLQNMGG
tara:strand:- start:509 stop:1129 length:621 start_codon:yes stop_codon:yes gene_type:complete